MRERLVRTLPIAVAALLATVPFRGFLSDGVPLGRDLLDYFVPLKTGLSSALLDGHLPWIDVFRGGGLPLLQSPGAAAFDPGNLLFLAFSPGTATKAWIVLRIVTGVLGFAAFARRLGLSQTASGVAGLLYGLSGVTLSLASFFGASSAHAALPWFAAALAGARRDGESAVVARVAVATALLAVTSVPEYAIYAFVILVLLALADPHRAGAEQLRPSRVALRWALGLALGLAMAAPALAVLVRAAGGGVRSPGGGMNERVAAEKSLPPVRLLEVLAEGVVADWSRDLAVEGVPEYPYLPSLTPGRVGLVLAVLGLLLPGKGKWRALALIAGGAVLALGPLTPVWTLLARHAPFFSSLRYPEKHMILGCFGLAWLSALGLAALEERLPRRSWAGVAVLLGLLVVADRDSAARSLLPLSPASLLESPPAVLAPLAGLPSPGTPPRVFFEAQYALVPPERQPQTLPEAFAMNAAFAFPASCSLHRVGAILERDYDLTSPRQLFEWTLLLEGAVPSRNPFPRRLALALGAGAVVAWTEGPNGRLAPRLDLLPRSVPPFRFVGRVLRNADGRRLFRELLDEGADPGTAYVVDDRAVEPSEERPGRGTVLSVADTPAGLSLTVEAGPGGSYLFLSRPRVSARRAELDGRPVETEEAWFGFTGLRVPEGRHTLMLAPAPGLLLPAVIVGLMASLATLTLFLRGSIPGRSRLP